MTVYRKRVASSFAALRETLTDRLTDLRAPGRLAASDEDLPDDEEDDDPIDEDTAASLAIDALEFEAQSGIEEILTSLKKLPADTKSTYLLTILERLRADGYPQVMVFTQFTDTLDFLRNHVAATGQRVMCFSGRGGERRDNSGTWRTIPRDEVKRIFRIGDADILLCTDAAAEGLNFQFCGAIVNYDMPWNPMRDHLGTTREPFECRLKWTVRSRRAQEVAAQAAIPCECGHSGVQGLLVQSQVRPLFWAGRVWGRPS
jgi:hypothetical protein